MIDNKIELLQQLEFRNDRSRPIWSAINRSIAAAIEQFNEAITNFNDAPGQETLEIMQERAWDLKQYKMELDSYANEAMLAQVCHKDSLYS